MLAASQPAVYMVHSSLLDLCVSGRSLLTVRGQWPGSAFMKAILAGI